MAVRIRLARRGRKKLALFDLVVADSRSPRDGRFIEKIGTYNPLTDPATIQIDENRAFQWLMNGAQPSDTVRAMLSYKGVLLRKHLQIGVIKGAMSQEEADRKLEEWRAAKESQVQAKRDRIAMGKQDAAKSRRDAETKIREARLEALKKKAEVAAQAEEPAGAEAPEEQVVATDTPTAEETKSPPPPEPSAPAEGDAPPAPPNEGAGQEEPKP